MVFVQYMKWIDNIIFNFVEIKPLVAEFNLKYTWNERQCDYGESMLNTQNLDRYVFNTYFTILRYIAKMHNAQDNASSIDFIVGTNISSISFYENAACIELVVNVYFFLRLN